MYRNAEYYADPTAGAALARIQRAERRKVSLDLIIKGKPITKKNHMKIITIKGRPSLVQSAQYKQYAEDAGAQLRAQLLQMGGKYSPISVPINLKCVYYMPTRRRVDLCNLLAATCDILTEAGILLDDNRDIVAGHDGSCVLYDKQDPRVEITIQSYDKETYTQWK